MSAPDQTPTPWVNCRTEAEIGIKTRYNCDEFVDADNARTLERHLRRIVEAKSRLDQAEQVLELVPHGNPTHDDMWAALSELDEAIQAAKEEIK